MRRWLAIVALSAVGCGAGEVPADAGTWPALREPADNPSTPAKIELGRLLFYDPILSADGEVACATCHSELWGMSDGLSHSIGVDGDGPVGPGRQGPNVTTRNALTLWNVGYRASLFWDGRASSLEEQALLPIENDVEMGRDLDALVVGLDAIDEYHGLFVAAFGEPASASGIARALAAFQRTFISKLAPYDRYMAGDEGALSATAAEGLALFDEVGCAGCHTPPLFESEQYHARGLRDDDPGRAEVTHEPADEAAFRVPTLRNLRETGPYFHDGGVDTLEDAVAHEAAQTGALTEDEVAAIATFIRKGLMDRSGEPDRPESVPSGLEVPADGFRIPR